MKTLKIIVAYIFAIFSILLMGQGVFFTLREVIYRSMGKLTAMSEYYPLTTKQSIILNSVDGIYQLIMLILFVKWFIQKKYTWLIITSILVWMLFFVIAYIEDKLR